MSIISPTVSGGRVWEPSSGRVPAIFEAALMIIAVCLSFLVVMYAGTLIKALTYASPEKYDEKFLLPDLFVMDVSFMQSFPTFLLAAIVSLVIYFLLKVSDGLFNALGVIAVISVAILLMGSSIGVIGADIIGSEMETWLSEEHGLEHDNAYKNLFSEFETGKTVTMEDDGKPVSINFSFDEETKKISVERVVP